MGSNTKPRSESSGLLMGAGSSSTSSAQIDELVQYVTLHVPLPWMLSWSVLPFFALFGVWLYLWVFVYGVGSDEPHFEAFLIVLVGIAFLQLLVCLCCFWSVHIQTFLNCRKVSWELPYVYCHIRVLFKLVIFLNSGLFVLLYIVFFWVVMHILIV